MSIEELKTAVSEALEADLFDLTHIESDETETDPVPEEPLTHSHCNCCKYYDWYLYECTVEHCPYIEDDELDGQQHLF